MKALKNKNPKEYGKPYTPKEFRQVGIGMIVAGIIVLLYGMSVYQHGSEDQMIQTKGGSEIYGSGPHDPLYIMIAVAGGAAAVSGLVLWIRGRKKQ